MPPRRGDDLIGHRARLSNATVPVLPAPNAPSTSSPDWDRIALWTAIALVVAASWGWLLYQDWAMRHMDVVVMAMPARGAWGVDDLVLVFTMWTVMMIAMMLPTAVPMLVVYRRVAGTRPAGVAPAALTLVVAAGYLAAWTAYAAIATLAQWALHAFAAISPLMAITLPLAGGAVLMVAGVYQWSGAKQACLDHCRSPLVFVRDAWRPGYAGAFTTGLRHGIYCTGCCWLLMGVLFVVGVMNLVWIALITLFVLAEKALPRGELLARTSGIALIAWGGWVVLRALAAPG